MGSTIQTDKEYPQVRAATDGGISPHFTKPLTQGFNKEQLPAAESGLELPKTLTAAFINPCNFQTAVLAQ